MPKGKTVDHLASDVIASCEIVLRNLRQSLSLGNLPPEIDEYDQAEYVATAAARLSAKLNNLADVLRNNHLLRMQ